MAHKKPVPFTVFENCQKSIIASKIEYEVDFGGKWTIFKHFFVVLCRWEGPLPIVFAIDLFWGWAMICTSSLYQIKLAKPAFLVSYKKTQVELVISRFDYCLSWCWLSFYVLSKLRGHLCIKTSCGCSCWVFLVVGGSRPGIKWQQTKYDSSSSLCIGRTYSVLLFVLVSMRRSGWQ